jgi:hypothetical protein
MRSRFILCLALIAAAPPAVNDVQPLPLTATAVPLNPDDLAQSAVGELRYLGGLALRSTTRSFGGLSGLRAGPGNRLLAISDTGNWVSFVTVERGKRLVGVKDGVIAPLLDAGDRKAATKSAGDAESLDWNPRTGEALVSFEQDHRIQVYRGIDPARPETLRATPAEVIRNSATAGWPANGGGEALAVLADGSRLLFEEDGEDANGLSPVLLVKDGTTRQLLYRRPPGYKPTDAVEIAPGELLLLNRHFSVLDGVSIIVTRVRVADIMEPHEVARLLPPLTIDNLEGLAVRQVGGRTFAYMVSDDNFNGWQRVLLLKFELVATSPGTAGRRAP